MQVHPVFFVVKKAAARNASVFCSAGCFMGMGLWDYEWDYGTIGMGRMGRMGRMKWDHGNKTMRL